MFGHDGDVPPSNRLYNSNFDMNSFDFALKYIPRTIKDKLSSETTYYFDIRGLY